MMTASSGLYLGLVCARCGVEYEDGPWFEGCDACRDGDWASNLIPTYDLRTAGDAWRKRDGRGVWRYPDFLPVRDRAARISLGEGGTPLIDISALASDFGRLWLKNEAVNPTWSYKDRLCTVSVSKGVELGARLVAASSTGNHGASAAAYAARAGLEAVVLTREDVDRGTTAFMQAYGARVVRTTRRGRWTLLAHGVHSLGWYPVSTYTRAPTGNPFGPDGYKSIAFEILEETGRVPDAVVVPASYGEGLAGIWQGFVTLREIGLTDAVPRMVAAEPKAGGPLATALEQGRDRVAEVGSPDTIATSIGSTIATDRALLTLRESNGTSVRVSDEQILAAQLELGRAGAFLEPAGAAGFAALPGLRGALANLPDAAEVVVVGTAGGLRQIGVIQGRLPDPPFIEPEPAQLEQFLRTSHREEDRQ